MRLSAAVAATAGAGLTLFAATGAGAATGARRASSAEPLRGTVIGIDPGHNGRNYTDPAYLNHLVWNGREWEPCDTGQPTDRHIQPVSSFRCGSSAGWHGLVQTTAPGEPLSGGYSSPQNGGSVLPGAHGVGPPAAPASAEPRIASIGASWKDARLSGTRHGAGGQRGTGVGGQMEQRWRG
jgi:hypothetical protein